MDIFSHGLWSYVIFNKKDKWKAVLSGILPDVISFGPYFVMSIFAGSFTRGKPGLDSLPSYVFSLYNITHSFITFVLIALLLYIITRKFYLWLLAWPLHVFIDIFSHDASFFPTPFLYPISSYRFSGYNWAHPKFIIINYILLIIAYVYLSANKKRNKDDKPERDNNRNKLNKKRNKKV